MFAPIVVLSAVRTPWGRLLGSLSDVSAVDLGHAAAEEAISRAGVVARDIDRVVMGNVLAHGCDGNPAEAATRRLPLAPRRLALTVRAGCASGLSAIVLAAEAVSSGAATVALAGGFESASGAPHLAFGLRHGLRLGGGSLLDAARLDGPAGIIEAPGAPGTRVLEGAGPGSGPRDRSSGEPRDKAPGSERAAGPDVHSRGPAIGEASPSRRASGEICAVHLPARRGESPAQVTSDDERPFPAGGSPESPKPPLADGAAAVVIASESWARSRGIDPLCKISIETDPLASASSFEMILADLPGEILRDMRGPLGSSRTEAGGPEDPDPLPGHAAGADGARLVVSLAHAVRRRGAAGLALAGAATGAIVGVRLEP